MSDIWIACGDTCNLCGTVSLVDESTSKTNFSIQCREYAYEEVRVMFAVADSAGVLADRQARLPSHPYQFYFYF